MAAAQVVLLFHLLSLQGLEQLVLYNFKTPTGWSIVRNPGGDAQGDWLITFPSAAPSALEQTIQAQLINTNFGNTKQCEVENVTAHNLYCTN